VRAISAMTKPITPIATATPAKLMIAPRCDEDGYNPSFAAALSLNSDPRRM
jgi:hypothetical protein